jgi:hypothetical protein
MRGSSMAILLVCGVARSGTTATTKIMNLHPAIYLGDERYRQLFERYLQNEGLAITPELFQKHRFFDYRRRDSRLASMIVSGELSPHTIQDELKFDSAKFVGDKLPNAVRDYNLLFRRLPSARVVFMARNPYDVAASWNKRAREARNWPPTQDAKSMVEEYNKQFRSIYTSATAGHGVVIVRYEKIFSQNGPDYVGQLLGLLGLEESEPIRNWYKENMEHIWRIRNAKRDLSVEDLEYINSAIEWQLVERVRGLAL